MQAAHATAKVQNKIQASNARKKSDLMDSWNEGAHDEKKEKN